MTIDYLYVKVNSFLLFFHIWCERADEHNIHDMVYILYQHIIRSCFYTPITTKVKMYLQVPVYTRIQLLEMAVSPF